MSAPTKNARFDSIAGEEVTLELKLQKDINNTKEQPVVVDDADAKIKARKKIMSAHPSMRRVSYYANVSSKLSGNVHQLADAGEKERERLRLASLNEFQHSHASSSMSDKLFYGIENRIAASSWFPFILLGSFVSIILVFYGFLWYLLVTKKTTDNIDTDTINELEATLGFGGLADSLFLSMQVLMASDFSEIPDIHGLRIVYFLMIFSGLVVFAVLVGFITDSVTSFMNELETGKTKVAQKEHTLILGWNEATTRVVIQTSFLRRQYQMLNEEKFYHITYYFPFMTRIFGAFGLLERPSTSMAAHDIVIMTNNLTKAEMHLQLANAMAERGIDPRRTAIGTNIICRVGNPTQVNDLIRVAAHRAGAIVVMLTEEDKKEADYSNGSLHNGATLRCVLALRHVIFTNKYSEKPNTGVSMCPNLRIILHMTSPSTFVDAANFCDENNNSVIHAVDLSKFLNSVMFSCASQPGLAKVLTSILNFEGTAIRRRKAQNLRSGPNNEFGDCIGKTFKDIKEQFTLAIFIGLIRPTSNSSLEMKTGGFGLCPDPNTIIQRDDLLIFIGPRSNPRHDFAMIETMQIYQKKAKKLLEEFHPSSTHKKDNKILGHTLLCGWREIWENHPERFIAHCHDLMKLRLPGSSVIMCNSVSNDHFGELMQIGHFSRGPDETLHPNSEHEVINRTYINDKLYPGVYIIHCFGDPALPHILEPIVIKRKISTVIVLGTEASLRLNAHSRDTRVLSISLLLRKIWQVKGDKHPMHVIGENEEDLTSKLALTPRHSDTTSSISSASASDVAAGILNNINDNDNDDEEDSLYPSHIPIVDNNTYISYEPDFINSQAINARVLTQVMAYPHIATAVADLFEEHAGCAKVCILPVFSYVPAECFLRGTSIDYGIIRNCVLQAQGERSICIGWICAANSDVHLAPAHDSQVCFKENDKLVIIKREMKDENKGKEEEEEEEEKRHE